MHSVPNLQLFVNFSDIVYDVKKHVEIFKLLEKNNSFCGCKHMYNQPLQNPHLLRVQTAVFYGAFQGVARGATPCGAISKITTESCDQRDRRAQVGGGLPSTAARQKSRQLWLERFQENELMQTGSNWSTKYLDYSDWRIVLVDDFES